MFKSSRGFVFSFPQHSADYNLSDMLRNYHALRQTSSSQQIEHITADLFIIYTYFTTLVTRNRILRNVGSYQIVEQKD
jgi:hypothetical protein